MSRYSAAHCRIPLTGYDVELGRHGLLSNASSMRRDFESLSGIPYWLLRLMDLARQEMSGMSHFVRCTSEQEESDFN